MNVPRNAGAFELEELLGFRLQRQLGHQAKTDPHGTVPQTVSIVIWNQPVCQKSKEAAVPADPYDLQGFGHQGASPTGPTTLALGQWVERALWFANSAQSSGTTRQLSSERTSSMRPSPKTILRPRITPAVFTPLCSCH